MKQKAYLPFLFERKVMKLTLHKLVVTEKPSVAASIAKVIGAVNRNDGYIESNGYIVTWCIGHLVSLAVPESYDEKYKKFPHRIIFKLIFFCGTHL